MIAPSSSRYSSNDMVHNHYLEEAKKKTQERCRNSRPSVMPSAGSQSTANGISIHVQEKQNLALRAVTMEILPEPTSNKLSVVLVFRKEYGCYRYQQTHLEQYMALTRRDRPGVVIPELGNDVDFEIRSQFLNELRCNLFAGTNDEDAYEHVRRVLEITNLFHIPGVTRDAVMLRVFPITLTRAARRWKNLPLAGSIST
ncbi:hypothetical protein Tco_1155933 [Tanacetum coccineum]